MSLIMAALNKVKEDREMASAVAQSVERAFGTSLLDSPSSVALDKVIKIPSSPLSYPSDDSKPMRLSRLSWGFLKRISLIMGGMLILFLLSYGIVNSWKIESHVQNSALKDSKEERIPRMKQIFGSRFSVKESAPMVDVILEGIILDRDRPLCLIKGGIFGVGDLWDGKRIIAISQKDVTLIDHQGNFLKLKPS